MDEAGDDRRPARTPAPGDLAPAGARCARPYPYATAPRPTYPVAYNRRQVEGWAILSFDVAPWDDIGNVKVLAAQPAEDFGTHAVQVMCTARFEPSAADCSGCVERVNFVTGPKGAPEPTAPPPPLRSIIDPPAPALQHDERRLTIARYRWHPAPPSRRLKLVWFATLGTILVVQIATWRGMLRYSSWWILGVLLVIQGVIVWRWPKVRPIE